jgi:hypothetical protein
MPISTVIHTFATVPRNTRPVYTAWNWGGGGDYWGVSCTPWAKTILRGLIPRGNYTEPSDRRLSTKLAPTFADRGCHLVRVMDSYGRILGFLDLSRYFFFPVAPQLYSRG